MEKGSVQIYYGAGRGKTNAALGNALRAAGENKSVIIIQFLKGKTDDQIAYMKQLEYIYHKRCDIKKEPDFPVPFLLRRIINIPVFISC